MARTAVTITTFVANAGTTEPAGTAVDPTNGHVINAAGIPVEEIMIRVANTNGTQRTVTVKAGGNPPALEAGQGDLAVVVPATTGVKWIGPLSSGRFVQADGTILVDLEASIAGTITAYRFPRRAA